MRLPRPLLNRAGREQQRAAAHPTTSIDSRRKWAVLAVVLVGAFMILLDGTIVNVAIPPIQRDLSASYGAIEWMIAGYALSYGLLMIPAGRLADRFGHKRLFLIGLAGFTVTSLLCGTAASPGELVVWRVLQGAMAGVLNPPILAVIQNIFEPKQRGRAFAWYGAVAGISTAAGPLLGGLLVAGDLYGLAWRPIFFLNLPIGIAALVAALFLVPESRGRAGGLDPVGIVLISAAMLLLTFPLVQGREAGWPAWAFGCLGAAVPVLAAFVLWELHRLRRGRAPLVDVRLFTNRSFSAGVGLSLSYFAGFIGLIFILSLHLQNGLGRTALYTGVTLMAFAGGTFVGAAFSDLAAARLGRHVLHIGCGLVLVGMTGVIVTVHATGAEATGWQLLPALLVAGIGSGLVIAPNVNIVLRGVPARDAGAASGVLNTAQRLGQAIGIAVVGVALFGALGDHAARSAEVATPPLRAELTTAGMDPIGVDHAITTFARCFEDRAHSADPTAIPPSCPTASTGATPAFATAARRALADDFTQAVQVAAEYTLGAVAITFLLVFLLPRRTARPADSDRRTAN